MVVALLMELLGFGFHCSAHFTPFEQAMACVDRPTLLLYFSLTRKVYPIGLPLFGVSSLEEPMAEKRSPIVSSLWFFYPILAILLIWSSTGCGQKPSSLSPQATAAEADNYKPNIELTHIGLAKGESFLGNHVYYVEGKVKNQGNRVVERIEITFLFKDNMNQVVLKESRKAVEYKGGGGLEPQQANNFQVAFDHLPKDWNHVIPDVVVNKIVLR